jgi:hypothetical protein
MSEPNFTVKYSVEDYKNEIHRLVKSNESNFFIEENWYILRWIYRIRNANCSRGIQIGFLQPDFLWVIYRKMMQSAKKLKRTDDDIRDAVNLWCINRNEAEEQYGHISNWDMSRVTNLCELGHSIFNDDISQWDVSNVRYYTFHVY